MRAVAGACRRRRPVGRPDFDPFRTRGAIIEGTGGVTGRRPRSSGRSRPAGEASMIPTGTTGRIVAVLGLDWKPSLLAPGLYLAGALLLGAFVIALVRRWRREPGPERLTPT